MKTIYAFAVADQWGFVDREVDLPDNASVSFEANFNDLSDDEEQWFCMECLIFDAAAETVTFDHEKFDRDIRNVLFRDLTTDEGAQADWLEKRIAAYPSIGDQLDMIYHDQMNGTDDWKTAIAAAKSATPKE